MKVVLFSLLMILASCGTEQQSKCNEKAEVDMLALDAKNFGSLGNTIYATITTRDLCPNATYSAIFTIKEGNEMPANCQDGTSQIVPVDRTSFDDLPGQKTYYFRVCLTRDGYTSPGVTRAIELN